MRANKTTLSKPKIFSMREIIEEEPGTRQFLEAIARNSKQTRTTYAAGLLAFHRFLNGKNTLFGILEPLRKNELDVYVLLDDFVSFLLTVKNQFSGRTISLTTVDSYMVAVRSYLQFYDVDIAPNKFKRKVRMPKIYREDEEALEAADIRKILLACNNRRLRPYLLVLASGGLRAAEACAIRLCDIDFTLNPTKVRVRKEYAKTRVARDIYISDEATKYLRDWIEWKHRIKKYGTNFARNEEDLVFTQHRDLNDARTIYTKIRCEFIKLLKATGFEKRKEGILRRTITLHSFRRYVKTVISDQVSKDYSEWFLGHSKSPYYTLNEKTRREHYRDKCMKYLTFLDYTALENTGASNEAKLEEAQKEIDALKKQISEFKHKEIDVENLRKEFIIFKDNVRMELGLTS